MKGTVRILVLDGTPDSDGNIIRPEGLTLPEGDRYVVLEDRVGLDGVVGAARNFRMEKGVVSVDLDLLDFKLPEPCRMVLFPIPFVAPGEWKGKVITKAALKNVALSISQHSDKRIVSIGNQGIKP